MKRGKTKMGRPALVRDPQRRSIRLGSSAWAALRTLTKPGSWSQRVRMLIQVCAALTMRDGYVWCSSCGMIHAEDPDHLGDGDLCDPADWEVVYSLGATAPKRWQRAYEVRSGR